MVDVKLQTYNDANWAFCDLSKSTDCVNRFDSTDFHVTYDSYNSVKTLSNYVNTYLHSFNLSQNIVLLRALHRYCAFAVTNSTTDYTDSHYERFFHMVCQEALFVSVL